MEHVLCMMNPYELINLSLASSRTRRNVANFSRIKSKHRVSIGIADEPYICIVNKYEDLTFSWTSDEPTIVYEKLIIQNCVFHKHCSYSRNPIKECMEWYDYVKGVLRCQVEAVQFGLSAYPSQNKLIIDWLCSQQISTCRMEIKNTKEGFEDDLKYLLNNITLTVRVCLFLRHYKDDFQVDIPTSIYYIVIWDAKFINFEQLIRLKNRSILFNETVLTARDINEFLKSWRACESHLELEFFEMGFSGAETMNVILDLPHEETTDKKVIEPFKKHFENTRVKNFFNIERSDGKVATVGYELFNGHQFYMITN
uniref:FBA_2 domain-containing protein n=1 Tax=Caenorhabditis tropicalis TaxID=1561998 RepID=A0A1I7TI33_9PELO